MTYGYDLEMMVVALNKVEESARELFLHKLPGYKLPDRLAHRVAHIRGEAHSLRVEIEKTKGSCNG